MLSFTDPMSRTVAEWRDFMSALGERPYAGDNVFHWLHGHQIFDYSAMTNLSKALREKLSDLAPISPVTLETEQLSEDGTRKYLVRIPDEKPLFVECVLMKYHYGYSICISSQAGCRMGCSFCASTLGGLERSLTAGEMLQEVYAVQKAAGVRVSHIVLMGCGEPLDNLEGTLRFLELIHDPDGQGQSFRDITVSTCGLPQAMRVLADKELPITLAVSLHAPNHAVRSRIMQVARGVTYEELLDSCRYYVQKTGRRITFEYLLILDVNDKIEHARELAGHLADIPCHVNLIPLNEVRETGLKRSSESSVLAFQKELERQGIPVTRRRELGADIDAACGQLRWKQKQ